MIFEPKLGLFQIKLNLKSVVTNIILHDCEIGKTEKYNFSETEKKV